LSPRTKRDILAPERIQHRARTRFIAGKDLIILRCRTS
jgi:hypothetical protein